MPSAPDVRATCAIDLVEQAYRLDGTEAEWLETLLHSARPDLDKGCGVYAFTGHDPVPNLPAAPTFAQIELKADFAARLLELNRDAPNAIYDLLRTRLSTCGGLEQVLGTRSPVVEHFRQLMAPTGVRDGFCLFAQDAEGGSITLSAPSRTVLAPAPRVRGIWSRVGLHVAAALRLRRRLAERATSRDALLTTNGALEDASTAIASDHSARDALREAVQGIERARSGNLRKTPERALELWRGLARGEWSLVDHWESDGRRYLAAYSNQPRNKDPRALTANENAVCNYLALGASNKEIAYTLGLPLGTVSACIGGVLRKLRLQSRVELAVLLSTKDAARFDVPIGDRAVEVLSLGAAPVHLPSALTPAEQEVVRLAARGLRNEHIAAERGVSINTVAKQLRASYAKLGVDNRRQLASHVTRADESPRTQDGGVHSPS